MKRGTTVRLVTTGAVLVALCVGSLAAQGPASLTGVVRDADGYLIPRATVSVAGTPSASTVTDESGHFHLEGDFKGPLTLQVVRPGFKTSEVSVSAETISAAKPIDITLQVAPLHQQIEVQGAAPPSESPDHVKINVLEIVKTAGTNADAFRALQTMPGLVKVDEGAGLYVEGGDYSEVSTYVNRSLVPNPYRYETPTGGLFGSVDPFFIDGVSLNTAGFPARYGNALSGVLDLNMLPRPERTTIFANVGLASTSVDWGQALGKHVGFRVAGNKSFTDLLFAVNQPDQKFTRKPSGYDGSGGVYLDTKRLGNFDGYVYRAADNTGVEISQLNFFGLLTDAETKGLYSGSWERSITHDWKAQAAFSHSTLDETNAAGVLNLEEGEFGTRGKLDLSGPFAGGTLRVGYELEQLQNTIVGSAPKVGQDLGGVQGTKIFDENARETRQGTYVEFERTALKRFTLNMGVRSDGYHTADSRSVDPRLALIYRLSKRQTLRLAWGIYHQGPNAFYLAPVFGNPQLGLISAQHMVLGYAYGEESGNFFLRLEGYNKRYGGLPVQDPTVNFLSTGYGFSRGIDTLVKGRWGSKLDGWISYSFLSALRRWTTINNAGVFPGPATLAPPDFDIPHTLQVVLHGKLPANFSCGSSFRVASGKPYTPVESAVQTPQGFIPTFGPFNSARVPTYVRMDFNASRPFTFLDRAVLMPYLGITNLLDRKNIFSYVYSPDFSQRLPGTGTLGRSFYFGLVFQR